MVRQVKKSLGAVLVVAASFAVHMDAAALDDPLAAGFENVPMVNRPWCYWWWLNGHVDRKTITADLESMRDLGFGGLLMFDARGYWEDEDHLLMAKPEIEFASPQWQDNVTFAIREANRLGLEFTMNISSSGGKLEGPWAVGADAPKRLMGRVVPLPAGRCFAVDWAMPKFPHYHDVAIFAVRYEGPPVPDRTWFPVPGHDDRRTVVSCVELTDLITSDHTFAWDVPNDGQWALVRFGWCTIPGHERDVDMLDPKAVEGHWRRVFDPLRQRVGDLFGKTFTHVYSVSWEGAFPTWTSAFEEGFRKSTGYAIRPYLPCLAGFDVTTIEKSDAVDHVAFIRDFRRVRNELFRDQFYGKIRELAHEAGLKLYSESGGPWSRGPEQFLYADQLRCYSVNEIPQGEFWYKLSHDSSPFHGVRGAVSTAHVFGLRRASAEAFTHMVSHWSIVPGALKCGSDDAFVDGINHLVWHTFTCSPEKFGIPGHEYFAGTHINRNVTWHKEAGAFVKYLGRCQWMLQQGLPVADYTVWAGATPYQGFGRFREKPYEKSKLRLPPTSVYDLMDTDALLARVNVKDGRLVLPDGMTYGALVLDPENTTDRTPAVEAKLSALRKAGAHIVETREADAYFAALVPDFTAPKPFYAQHRRLGDEDLYFVVGEGPCEALFKVRGKVAEIWDPVTTRRRAARVRETDDGRSAVQIDLPREGSAFVVFRPQHGRLDEEPRPSGRSFAVEGPWQASFAYHPGIKAIPPRPRELPLGDFSQNADFDVAHFSGAVTYRTEFKCTDEDAASATLSLGRVVGGVVTVRINGSDLGVVWTDPWEVRIPPSVLKKGSNVLEVRFVNAWSNRLIGDCIVAPTNRVTSSNLAYHTRGRKNGKPSASSGYDAADRLMPNGLMGPVMIRPDRSPWVGESLQLKTEAGVGHLCFTSAEKGYGISGFSFRDVTFATNVVPPALWRLVFRVGVKGEERILEASRAGEWKPLDDGGAAIVWKNLDLDPGDAAVDVLCHVTPNAESGRYEFRLDVRNRSAKYGLSATEYPRLGKVVAKGAGTVILPGGNWGGVRRRSLGPTRLAYPDYDMPIQLVSFEQSNAGVMLAALDPQATVKHLNLDDQFNCHFEFAGVDAGKPGAAGTPKFPVALYPYDGNWWKAAKSYRSWAVQNAAWMKAGSLVKRQDPAVNLFRDIGFWMLVDANDHGLEAAERILDRAFERIHGRVRLATHFYCWHKHPFDTLYPDYFPARAGFKEFVERQTRKGVIVSPYVNGRLWDRSDADFASIATNICVDAKGEPYQETWNNRPFSAVCPWTQLWLDKMVSTGDRLVDGYGVNSLYYDQMASMVALNCYADWHGHPIGGGEHWTEGYRKILLEVRRRHPGVPITSENFSEPYVDVNDGFLTWCPLDENDIPLISAVYSGYCQTFGCRTSPWYTDEAFRAAQGRSFLWGCQPGWEREWILEEKFASRFEYLIRLAELHVRERESFCDGELLGEVKNRAKTPILALKWERWGKPIDAHIPAVQAVRWRSPSGRELVAICNYADVSQVFDGGADVGCHELSAGEVKVVHLY